MSSNFKEPTGPGKSTFTGIAENQADDVGQRLDNSMPAQPGVIGIFPKRRDFLDLLDFLDLPGEMNG